MASVDPRPGTTPTPRRRGTRAPRARTRRVPLVDHFVVGHRPSVPRGCNAVEKNGRAVTRKGDWRPAGRAVSPGQYEGPGSARRAIRRITPKEQRHTRHLTYMRAKEPAIAVVPISNLAGDGPRRRGARHQRVKNV